MNEAMSKTIFLFRKNSWLERTTCTCTLCSDGHITGSIKCRYLKNVDPVFKVYSTKSMCKHMIPIMATGK